ncbi:MAG TPA: glycine betaine ABC transporter substrate-binding protein [Candidatus Binatia bacterium]
MSLCALAPLVATVALAMFAGCHKADAPVVVGSKNFTEQRILGEIVAQRIEAAGMSVDRKLDLGGTFVCDSALRSGQIDVYVEYTGTALGAILKQAPAPGAAPLAPEDVLRRVRAAYSESDLVWTPVLGFDNSFALVVRSDAAPHTISEAAAAAKTWRAAFGYEFEQRTDGYPALTKSYGITFGEVHTMDLGLLYQALTGGQADVVVGSATDAAIRRFGLRVLDDDKHAFLPYDAGPVVRRAALDAHPTLEPVLESLGGHFDVELMRRLNEEVDGKGRSPADVVRELYQAGH